MPAVPACFEYLLGLFFASGQAMQSGHGLIPLTWAELKAFREENELDLCLWEKELLKHMSEAYCSEYSRASDPKRPSPYVPEQEEETDEDRIANAIRIRGQMRAFRKKQT